MSDYQLAIDILEDDIDFDKIQDNGEDIRITNSEDVLLDHYIEDFDDNSARVWVKIPHLSSSETKTLNIYYGNDESNGTSNADDVFDIFDDFENELNNDKWEEINPSMGNIDSSGDTLTITQTAGEEELGRQIGIVSEKEISVGTVFEHRSINHSGQHFGINFGSEPYWHYPHGSEQDNPGLGAYYNNPDQNIQISVRDENDKTSQEDILNDSGWHTWRFERISENQTDLLIDGNFEYEYNKLMSEDYPIYFTGAGNNTPNEVEIDWVRVRKYTDDVPTYNIRDEESVRKSGL